MRTGIRDGAVPAGTQAEGQAPQLDRAPKLAPARRRWVGLGLVIILVGLGSFWIGRYPVSPALVLGVLAYKLGFGEQYWDPTVETVIVNVRLPRIALAMLVGGALATSGAAYQTLFKNPMVSPDLLGVSAGAGFDAAFAMINGWYWWQIQASALVSGLIAVAVAVFIGVIFGRREMTVIVLGGIVIGSFFQALISIIKTLVDTENQLPSITFGLMGSAYKILNGLPGRFATGENWKMQKEFSPQVVDGPLFEEADEIVVENILANTSDVTFVMRKETSDQLEQVGVPVVYLEWDDVDDVKTAVALVGEVLGVSDLAEEYLQYFEDKQIQAAELTAGLTDDEKKRVVYGDPIQFRQPHVIAEWWIDQAGRASMTDDGRTVEQPLTVLWALHKLYPERLSQDALEKEIFDFYSHFFKYDLSDEQLEEIINRQ